MAELEIDINMRIREWDVIQVKTFLLVIVSLRASFSIGGVARSHALTARERRRPSSFAARSRVLSQTPQNYFNLVQRDAILPKYQYFTDGSFSTHFSNCRKRAKN